MTSCLRHILLTLLVGLCLAVPALARVDTKVSGEAAMRWVDFERDKEGSAEDLSASSFLQRYSVAYETNGEINSGRAGGWHLLLGYEWASLDTSVNDVDADFSSGKLLYSGEINFAPGGLPLRLRAWSRDLTQATTASFNRGPLLEPWVDYDLLSSGQHISTGFTLLAGIKNGSYLGQYREILSQVPKLLIDYSETYNRDMETLIPEHNRLRDLAFVSLNKKDNWFHYRVTEFEDFEHPENNYEDRIYMIGTVDHSLARQWINLTNWIRISADGSLEQRQEAEGWNEDTYQLNLFAKLNRRDWTLSNFNSMSRAVAEGGGVEKKLDVPIYASGQLDPRNRWRMSLVQSSEEHIYPEPDLPVWNEHLLYASFQLESIRSSGLIATSRAAVDFKRGSLDDEGQAALVGLEVRTDGRRDIPFTWLADYSAGVYNDAFNDDTYVEQQLTLSGDYQHSQRLRFGGRQQLAVGLGRYNAYSNEYLRPVLAGNVNLNAVGSDVDGDSWRSVTSLYADLVDSSRLRQRFKLNFDYMDRGGVTTDYLELGHSLTYVVRELSVNMQTRYQQGDNVSLTLHLEAPEGPMLVPGTGTVDKSFSHLTTVAYAPTQFWETEGEAGVYWGSGEEGNVGLWQLIQRSDYTMLAPQGRFKKIASFEQEFVYEQLFGNLVEGTPWYAGLNLVATWYTSRFLTLGARGEFRHFGETGANVFEYGVNAQVPFEKLYVNVSYEYGQADDGWPTKKDTAVTEHRWEVDVRKTF